MQSTSSSPSTQPGIANMQPQSAQNMYVPSTGANTSGNVRTNQQAGALYRGPPTSPAPRNGGARQMNMSSMYQHSIHPNMVVATQFSQYPPRQPQFQSQQFQYQQHMQPYYYNQQFYPTIQPPPQGHQRNSVGVGVNTGVGVSVGVGVGNPISVQATGPNVPLTIPPVGAGQAQLALQPGTVITGTVPPGTGVLSNAATAQQVGYTSMVGVVSASVPTQPIPTKKRDKNPIPIIDPFTNKNILDDYKPKSKDTTSSEIDYQDQTSSITTSTVSNEIPVELHPPQRDHSTMYSIDVHQMTQPRDVAINQTPVVSAMSDAPSVEIYPTAQKSRNKKIPIHSSKDDISNQNAAKTIEDSKQNQQVIKNFDHLPTANSKNIDPVTTNTVQTKISQQQQNTQVPLGVSASRNFSSIEQNLIDANVASVSKNSSEHQTVSSVHNITHKQQQGSSKTSNSTSANLEKASPLTEVKSINNKMQLNEIESMQQKSNNNIALCQSQIETETTKTDNLDTNTKTDSINKIEVIQGDRQQLCNEVTNETSEQLESSIDLTTNCDETDRALSVSSVTNKSTALDEKSEVGNLVTPIEAINDSLATESIPTKMSTSNGITGEKQSEQNVETTIPNNDAQPTTSEGNLNSNTGTNRSEMKLLINYNEGQWSPNNPTGKKQYDRDQLLRLREATASRVQPEVKYASILPQTNLMPSFAKHSKHVQSIVGSLGGGNRSGVGSSDAAGNFISKQASMSGVHTHNSTRGMIHVNLSLNQDVKLNETDNAWRPRVLNKMSGSNSEGDHKNKGLREKEDLIRRVRGILNKLTLEKFDTLVEEIIKLKIDTPDKMEAVLILVFEKAIDEPNFSFSYARLCQRLVNESQTRHERMESDTKSNLAKFRSALIDKTEREFNYNVTQVSAKEKKLEPIIEKIKNCTDPAEKAELEIELEEEERKVRRRSGGTVRFIGELFKISMLTGKIIYTCIENLLKARSEDQLECLCKLLTTVGAKFEQSYINPKEPSQGCFSLDRTIAIMQGIASKTDKEGVKVSSRVRFMLQDVIDLRKNKWQSSRNETPKTMEQIEKEAKTEQMSAQYLNYNSSSGVANNNSGSGSSQNNKRDDRGSSRFGESRSASSSYGGSHSQRGDTSSGRRQQSGNSNNNDEWHHVHISKGVRSLALDSNKLQALTHNLDVSSKKMGDRSMFQWNRQSAAPSSTPSNSFAVLSMIDTSKHNDRDRSGPRNKGSYNKNSMERDRYGDRGGRSGSTQPSRDNSLSRSSQGVRGIPQMSTMQKSASHSKYIQQIPQSRMSGKTVGMSSLPSGVNSQAARQRSDPSLLAKSFPSVAPIAVFEMPSDSDNKLFKSVLSEIIESDCNSKATLDTLISERIHSIKENQRCGFLYYMLTDYVHLCNVTPTSRYHLGNFITYLIKLNFLSLEHFRLAYKHFWDLASELILDIPDLWLYIFQFVGPLISKGLISIHDLWANKNLEYGKNFLKTFLVYCTREIGPSFTRRMWKSNNIKWEHFMQENEVKSFIETNKFEYIEKENVKPDIDIKESKETLVKKVVDRVEHMLRDGSNADGIIDYINGNVIDIDKQFIRALTTTLSEFAITRHDESYKLEVEIFRKHCIPILQRYIDSVEERELECLHAMQLLVHDLEHPRGLLSELFAELYDGDVIPQDSFIKWREANDQSAGKGVAVMGLNQFFTHFLSGETSDDEDN